MNPWERRACGTSAAYQWHRRNEGVPVLCRPCRRGNASCLAEARRADPEGTAKKNRVARENYARLRQLGYSSAEADRRKWRLNPLS